MESTIADVTVEEMRRRGYDEEYIGRTDRMDRVLHLMLTENTGRAMCDSGGAYGRHWERNQGRKFLDEPATVLKFEFSKYGEWNAETQRCNDPRPDKFEIESGVSVYHYLKSKLNYLEDETNEFLAFCNTDERKHDSWHDLAEAYMEEKWPHKRDWSDGAGIWCNTYNGESMLDQVLLFMYLPDGNILLQVHGGCDVRGGYSAPKIFSEDDMWSLGGLSCATLSPERSDDLTNDMFPDIEPREVYWETENAGYEYTFFAGHGKRDKLTEYPATSDEKLKGKGHVFIDSDGNGYCPITGGKLHLGYY